MGGDVLKASALAAALSAGAFALIVRPGLAPAAEIGLTVAFGGSLDIVLRQGATAIPDGGQLVAGNTYTIAGTDDSTVHNLHIIGPNALSEQTSIAGTGIPFNVQISAPGAYEIYCDAHRSYGMQVRFTLPAVGGTTSTSTTGSTTTGTGTTTGTVTTTTGGTTTGTTTDGTTTTTGSGGTQPTAKPIAISGWVSGSGIGLRKGGKAVKRLPAGSYKLTVDDRSRRENFHLTGPKLDLKTAKAFKGKAVWRVVVRKNALYRYRSDAHPKRLAGTLRGR